MIVYAEAEPTNIPGLVNIQAQDGREWRDVTMAQAKQIVTQQNLSLHVQQFGDRPRYVYGADPNLIAILF